MLGVGATHVAYESLPKGVSSNMPLEMFRPRIPPQAVGALVKARIASMAPWSRGGWEWCWRRCRRVGGK